MTAQRWPFVGPGLVLADLIVPDRVLLKVTRDELEEIRAKCDETALMNTVATPQEWALFDVPPPLSTLDLYILKRFGLREIAIAQAMQARRPVNIVLVVEGEEDQDARPIR